MLSSQRKLLLQQLPMSRQFLFFMSFRLFNSKRSVFSQSLSMRNRLHFRLRGWLHCLQRKLRLILFRMQRKLPPLFLPLQNSKWNLLVSVLRLFRLHFLWFWVLLQRCILCPSGWRRHTDLPVSKRIPCHRWSLSKRKHRNVPVLWLWLYLTKSSMCISEQFCKKLYLSEWKSRWYKHLSLSRIWILWCMQPRLCLNQWLLLEFWRRKSKHLLL